MAKNHGERHVKDGTPKCAVCNRTIEGRPVKRMGNFYCSLYCAEVNRERMENLDLDKVDFSEMGDIVGRFMNTCMKCVFPLECREVRSFCGAYFEQLHDYITMRWCCHAVFGLSCMLSDGTVGTGTVRKIMARAEEIARADSYAGISPPVLSMAEGELADDFSYSPAGEDIRPAPPAQEHEHYLACLNCDKTFMGECLKLTGRAEALLPEIDALIDFPYCGHARYDLAAMLLSPAVTREKIAGIIEKSRKIAAEKHFRGAQYRIHYLSVARSIP